MLEMLLVGFFYLLGGFIEARFELDQEIQRIEKEKSAPHTPDAGDWGFFLLLMVFWPVVCFGRAMHKTTKISNQWMRTHVLPLATALGQTIAPDTPLKRNLRIAAMDHQMQLDPVFAVHDDEDVALACPDCSTRQNEKSIKEPRAGLVRAYDYE